VATEVAKVASEAASELNRRSIFKLLTQQCTH